MPGPADAKSHEITAIPELLTLIDLTKTIVTIDAIGCQKNIAQQIVSEGGGRSYCRKLWMKR